MKTTMKRWMAGSFLLGTALMLGIVPAGAADGQIVGPLRAQWESTEQLVMGVAKAMPEAKYDYKPTPEVRTFREQLIHLVGENYFYMGMVAGDKPPDRAKFDTLKTRDEILKALQESYDYGAKVLANLTDEKATETISIRDRQVPRWTGCLMNISDNMDHYGNLVVYLRLNGIVPPRTASRAQQR